MTEKNVEVASEVTMAQSLTSRVRFFTTLLAVVLLCVVATSANASALVEQWESPIPRFSESGIDPEAFAEFIGDGQLLQVGHDREMQLWSRKKVKTFSGVNIAVTSLVIDAPAEKIRAAVLDIGAMSTYMPQINAPKIIETRGEEFMAEFIQTYALPLIELKAKFHWQYTPEANGDISLLLHKGDIDSGVGRWEFQTLNNGKTLVSHSYWGDLKTAGLAFNLVLKAQPELEDTMVPLAAVLVLQQLREKFHGKGEVGQGETLPEVPVNPLFSVGEVPVKMLGQLLDGGRLIYVQPKQWITGEDGAVPVRFASVIKLAPYPREAVQPLLSDFSNIGDYFSSWVRDVKIKSFERYKEYLIFFKVKFGPVGVKLHYNINQRQASENVFTYTDNGSGDFVDVFGIWEFIEVGNNTETLVVFTNATQLSDHRFILRQGRKVPQIDLLMPIHMGLTVMTKQTPWLEEKLKK